MSVRDEKFHRMNKIRAALETSPRSFNDLLTIAYGSNPPKAATRTLQFDLAGLNILGIAVFEGGLYHSTENKTVYKNKAEYELTIKHSHRLMLGFGKMEPELLVNRLVQGLEDDTVEQLARAIRYNENPRENRIRYFLSHLKTEYYAEIYQPILRYKEIEEKYPKIKQMLKITYVSGISMSYADWEEDEVVEIDPKDPIFKGPFGIPDVLIYGTEPIEGTGIVCRITKEGKTPVFSEVIDNPDIVKEYITLKFAISSSVYGLLGVVINGTPLDGYCEACPLRNIKIEG